jgi:hypothetical protein
LKVPGADVVEIMEAGLWRFPGRLGSVQIAGGMCWILEIL